MTLDTYPLLVSKSNKDNQSKMAAVSAPPPVPRNSLSFSISRLLEKAGESNGHRTDPVLLVKPEAPAESKPEESTDDRSTSSVDVDDDDDDMMSGDDEDVKVHDSDDEEGSSSTNGRSLEYSSSHPHHPNSAPPSGIDWYALYALHQQQQQQHPAGMFPPSHLIPPGYPGAGRGAPPPAGYLSYPSSGTAGAAGAGGPAGPPPPGGPAAGFPALPPGSGQHPPDYHHHHQAGIPNAFAALLEATVFKDRLAAGRKKSIR